MSAGHVGGTHGSGIVSSAKIHLVIILFIEYNNIVT